jgi:hypothetical protein
MTVKQDYAFVSYDGPRLSRQHGVRDLIRRRAMKHTAAIRKRNGGYLRVNARQPLIRTVPARWQGPWFSDETLIPRKLSVPPTPNNTSLNLPLLQLIVPLTLPHIGISTVISVDLDLEQAGEIVGAITPEKSYGQLLSFIPSRYGHIPSITLATDCLLAKLSQMLRKRTANVDGSQDTAMKLYVAALKCLQAAIDDQDSRTTAETLCAVELLGLFEVRLADTLALMGLEAHGIEED